MIETSVISMIDKFARFQNQCADSFVETAVLHQPFDPRLVAICADQFNFIAARGKSVIELIKLDAIWDAQIIARPLIESCLKICFLCLSPKEARAELCVEYEDKLGVINELKLHDKATKTRRAVGDGHPMLDGLILSEERLQELQNKFPKEIRRDIESRWGFTRMVVALDKEFQDKFGISPFGSLFHTYGLSSHLIHADEMGLGTIRARKRLGEPQLSIVVNSHQMALLSAVAGAAMLSAISLAWAAEINIDGAMQLTEGFQHLHAAD